MSSTSSEYIVISTKIFLVAYSVEHRQVSAADLAQANQTMKV